MPARRDTHTTCKTQVVAANYSNHELAGASDIAAARCRGSSGHRCKRSNRRCEIIHTSRLLKHRISCYAQPSSVRVHAPLLTAHRCRRTLPCTIRQLYRRKRCRYKPFEGTRQEQAPCWLCIRSASQQARAEATWCCCDDAKKQHDLKPHHTCASHLSSE